MRGPLGLLGFSCPIERALRMALAKTGDKRPMRIAMMAITMSISMSDTPFLCRLGLMQ